MYLYSLMATHVCGYIHPQLAQQIAAEFKHTNISAFQIRLGGAKVLFQLLRMQACSVISRFFSERVR